MKKLRLFAIALAALLVIAFSSCSLSISGYSRNPPTIYATVDWYHSVNVTWSPVSNAVSYRVYDTTIQGTAIYIGTGTLSGSGYYYLDTNMAYGRWTYYKVESVFPDGGTSSLSAEVGGWAL